LLKKILVANAIRESIQGRLRNEQFRLSSQSEHNAEIDPPCSKSRPPCLKSQENFLGEMADRRGFPGFADDFPTVLVKNPIFNTYPKLPVLPVKIYILMSSLPNVSNVLPDSEDFSSWLAG
jgi:hypothetical protein